MSATMATITGYDTINRNIVSGIYVMKVDKWQIAERFDAAQRELVIQTADLPLGTLADMVEEGSIDLQPGFQRRERWSHENQSHLIESFLLNVPVPPIYLSEEKDGKYTAIDGKQRLRAITDFMKGRLALRSLDQMHEAEGAKFENLPSEISNALRLRPYMRVITILKQSDERLKYSVFLRLNRGGERLNGQEIRNVAFRGPLNDAIYIAADDDFLKERLKIFSESSEAYRQMQDAEFVLRFLALNRNLETFRGSLSEAMDSYMIDGLRMNDRQATSEVYQFKIALDRCQYIWGDLAFRRPDKGEWRDQTLAGMYDAQMLSVASMDEHEYLDACTRRAHIIDSTRELFADPEFDKAVRTGTNTPARIRLRVEKMRLVLLGKL